MINTCLLAEGAQIWRNGRGELHRDGDLPARIWANGGQEWWVNDQLHRDGGKPAIIGADGKQEWFIRDKKVTEEEARRLSPPPVQDPQSDGI